MGQSPQSDANFLLSKKAKYKCIKWSSDLELTANDKHALYQLHQNIMYSSLTLNCDIAKNIAEYSLGWIKLCPACEETELLITPSRLIDVCFDGQNESKSIQCPACLSNIYIDICDNHALHDRNAMINHSYCNWWIYWAHRDEIHWLPLPETSICKACLMECMNICKINKWYDSFPPFKSLCNECTYSCCLCENLFCNNKHIGYQCNECNLIYCQMCHEYCLSRINKSCINCFYHLQKYVSHYPNLQDRLIFNNYFRSLFDDHKSDFNLIIPSNIIHFIVAFINGDIINCCKPNCIEDVILLPQIKNYFHEHSPYNDQIIKCGDGHRNCLHMCDFCSVVCITNDISNLYYAFIDRYTTNYPDDSGYYAVDIPNIRICSVCWDQSGTIFKVCSNCEINCHLCESLMCPLHYSALCQSCGNIYCVSHWEEWNQQKCQLCNETVCWECQHIMDLDSELSPGYFSCLDRYNVCNSCWSPYIEESCNWDDGYAHCLDIVTLIRESSIFGQESFHHIIDIISVYAVEHPMILTNDI